MSAMIFVHAITLAILPIVVVGVIQRTKSLWAGRRGQPILQLAFDVARLLRKRSVFSSVTSFVFRVAPYVVLSTAVVSGGIVPLLGVPAPLAFPFDFVWFAYVWGLGRFALMLGALDTGSAFEGMGASREATFSAILEPALFLVGGAACLATHTQSFTSVLELRCVGPDVGVWMGAVVALFVVVQVESSRMPVDDPTTHLELTMIHEVMILDHSGPELAALQAASAIKMTVGLGLIATLLNPLVGRGSAPIVALANVALCLLLAVAIGTVESLVARLRMRAIPQYIAVALIAAAAALVATTFRGGAG
ncbi:MAG: respiratory chain complex I subunit 1 family protein [Polyangiales bacterium]